MAKNRAKVPPVAVVRLVGRFRNVLAAVQRKTVPAPIALLELSQAEFVNQAISAAAELGVADALADGPLHIDDLAARVGANPDALRRMLRALASVGIFAEQSRHRFALTPMAQPLRSDADVSLRALFRFLGSGRHRNYWSRLVDAVRTGETVADKVEGKPLFDVFREDREYGGLFDAAMTNVSQLGLEPTLAAYDFAQYRTIVDVAGGHGRLLTEILSRSPQSRGILFDMPEVVADASDIVKQQGLADRCTTEGGSFFESVPAGGDAYILKHIIHDWPDDEAKLILRNVRAAMDDSARLLLIEAVLPEGNEPFFGKLLDLQMLLTTGGRERTEKEWRDFLGKCGFELLRCVPTITPDFILELRPDGASAQQETASDGGAGQ